MDNKEKPYPVDEFGRPNGRNYHYKIPLDDSRALRKVRIADKIKGRFIERNPTDCSLYHVTFKTHDNKGPISGVEEYQHSEQWESPFTKSRYSGLEVRYANNGGTKVKGTVVNYGEVGRNDIVVNTTIDMTLGEVKKAANHESDELYNEFREKMNWVERESPTQRDIRQKNCEHKHAVEYDESERKRTYNEFEGWCSDCGKQFIDLP